VNTIERKAIKQIIEKKYYEKYLSQNKQLILMGIYFDKSIRNIVNFEEKDLCEI